MFLDIQRIEKLTGGASKTETRVRIPVGSKTSDAGRAQTIYATFKVAGAPTNFAQLVELLKKMDKSAVNITLPRITTGEAEIEIQLRPVYSAGTLAVVLESFDASAKERRLAREKDAAGNVPIPAPAPDAPHEDTAAQRNKKGAKTAPPVAPNGATV